MLESGARIERVEDEKGKREILANSAESPFGFRAFRKLLLGAQSTVQSCQSSTSYIRLVIMYACARNPCILNGDGCRSRAASYGISSLKDARPESGMLYFFRPNNGNC